MRLDKHSALIVVDMQNDFINGALAIKDADMIIEPINRCIRIFKENGLKIFATRDWHPRDHISFKEEGGIWPAHCIQNTHGAEFHKDLELSNAIIVSKGFNKDKEAYSGFEDTDLKATLDSMNIKRIFITGVATDYCVKNTALDALRHNFETYLIKDCIKGIDKEEEAIKEMQKYGVKIINSRDL
jgi:nicotinamidase/pyrazinamidase